MHHHRGLAAASIAVVIGCTVGAARAETPVVTLVLRADGFELSRALPAGVPFAVELRFDKDVDTEATLAYWPGGACTGGDPGAASPRDAQTFAMARTDPAVGKLAAELPALQLDTSYCLRLVVRSALTPLEAQLAAEATARKSAPAYNDAHVEAKALAGRLTGELAKILEEDRITGARPEELATLMGAVARDHVLSDANDAFVAARALADATPGNAANDQAATAAWKLARDALVARLTTALKSVRVEVASTQRDLRVPESTPQPQNYASIDLGVAIGLPFTTRAADVESLWMPYLGVNLYLDGVDRNIPLSAQRGGFWHNRFALTLGFSLDEPTLHGRELRGCVLGKIPFIAGGLRVTQYTRVSLGLMLFKYPDDSPAVDDTDLGMGAFVGYSVDLDLIKWIKGDAKGYGGF